MGTKGLRKCCNCGVWFKPQRRNAYHQRFCFEPACRTASKQASQRKWCRKNPVYFRGEVHVNRVRAWRRRHPGYWKGKGAEETRQELDALQELLIAQGFDSEGVTTFRNCLLAEISRPLQDLLDAQNITLVGLTSLICGEPLQEDIAQVLCACYERGRHINGRVPWMNKPPACALSGTTDREVKHEKTRVDSAATAATSSTKTTFFSVSGGSGATPTGTSEPKLLPPHGEVQTVLMPSLVVSANQEYRSPWRQHS